MRKLPSIKATLELSNQGTLEIFTELSLEKIEY